MISLKFSLKTKHHTISNELKQYEKWFNQYHKLSQQVKVIVHDHPIYTYGDLNDIQVDFHDRVIYVSLYEIEDILQTKQRYNIQLSDYDNAFLDILYDLNLQIAKFFILDNEKITFIEYHNNFNDYKTKMYYINERLTHQYIMLFHRNLSSYKKGITLQFNDHIPYELKRAFKMVRKFLLNHYEFPLKTKIVVTNNSLEGGMARGYFKYPNSIFNYPLIVVSTEEYESLKENLTEFDAVLNIIRILCHELGHYFEFVSGKYIYHDDDCEHFADDYEEKLIQSFIDESYYVYYKED